MARPDAQAGAAGGGDQTTFGLRILATTDLHMHLCAHNYYADRPDPATGLVRTAHLIRAARAEAHARGDAVLLVDNGDFLQGTPLGDVAVAEAVVPHPMMMAFGCLGYDAIGLGNHDFDFGPEVLMRVLADAPCPVIGSSLQGETGPVVDALRLELGPGISVGLLSVLPPQTALWNAHHVVGRFTFDDMTEAAARGAARLKAAGCDLVVVLAHTGLGPAEGPGIENAAIPIAGLAQVDAVIAGHTHQLLPGPEHAGLQGVDSVRGRIAGTPVVMPGWAGTHLGVIDLRLERGAEGWRVAASTTEVRPVLDGGEAVPEDPELAGRLAPIHAATRAALDRPVGRVARRLHSYFSLFGPDHALAVTADAQAAAVRPAIAEAGLDGLPLLSAVAPTKFGARSGPLAYTDVPEGPVTLRHVADLHVYRNELRVVRLRGAQVLDWLEMSASLFHRVDDGGALLFPDDVAGYNFDVIHGLEYRIDPRAPARFSAEGLLLDPGARRLREVRLDGAALDPGAEVLVVTNSYRAGGGGSFAALRGAVQVPVAPVELREAIAAHLRGDAPAGYAPPWRLAPLEGTGIEVRTGPAARDLLHEIAGLRPEELGPGEDGFLRLRLHP